MESFSFIRHLGPDDFLHCSSNNVAESVPVFTELKAVNIQQKLATH